MTKGDDTRGAILERALDLSTQVGLEGLTIGALAKDMGMSKSGLFAHFASKEDLQVQVLDAAAARFVEDVVAPALRAPRGLPRLEVLFAGWLDWATRALTGGCPFVSAATEFDDRAGPVHDRLVIHLQAVFGFIARAAGIAVAEGHCRPDLDLEQFVFEFWAILLSFHHFARLLRRDDARARAGHAFSQLLRRSAASS
jgi:AcrR family transcriptional regulator